jgi:hypothetical protein
MMQRREFLGRMVRTAVTKAEAVPGSMQLTFDETLSPARTTWE